MIKDYFGIEKLTETKDLQVLADGKGIFWNDQNATNVFCHNGDAMHFFGLMWFTPNISRANHFHKKFTEIICVVKGEVRVKMVLVENKNEVAEVILKQGEKLSIKPNCAHSFISTDEAIVLEFSPQNLEISDLYDFEYAWWN